MQTIRNVGRPKAAEKKTTIWVTLGNVNRLKRCCMSEQRKLQSESKEIQVKNLNDTLTILLDLKDCCDELLPDMSMRTMVDEIKKTVQERQKSEGGKQ